MKTSLVKKFFTKIKKISSLEPIKKQELIFYFLCGLILIFIFNPQLNFPKQNSFAIDGSSKPLDNSNSEILKNISALSFLVGDLTQNKIILEKNINLHLYPASITKLILAMVVIDNLSLDQEVEISEYALSAEGEEGGLQLKEKIKVKDLLEILLITSSNDAAIALEEALESQGKDVIDLMNKKIQEIGLVQSAIFDPRGIDRKGNFTTAYDLYLLAKEIYNNYPLIGEITRKPEEIVFSSDKTISHFLKNTNLLLKKLDNFWGGKTGTTPEAGDCLLTIFEFECSIKENNKNHLKEKRAISIIVLNSQDRYQDTEILYNFLKNNYFKNNCF